MTVLYQGKQWSVERRFSDFVRLDKKLRKDGFAISHDLPKKVVFGNFYPSVLDHRRKELNKYLQHLITSLSSDNTYLREFFEVDENMLKFAIKNSRNPSDICRSDNIRLILKRASQQMIDGSVLRKSPHQKEFNKNPVSTRSRAISFITESLSSKSKASMSSMSITPPRSANPMKQRHNSTTLTNHSNTTGTRSCHGPQDSGRPRSRSSSNIDTLIDSLQETSIIDALREDFENHSRIVSYELDESCFDILRDVDSPPSPSRWDRLLEFEDDKISDETVDVVNILTYSPPSNFNNMLTEAGNVFKIVKQNSIIAVDPNEIITDPGDKWEETFKKVLLEQPVKKAKPPFHRPPGLDSTVPLRLRFTTADSGANLPPHMCKHLL